MKTNAVAIAAALASAERLQLRAAAVELRRALITLQGVVP